MKERRKYHSLRGEAHTVAGVLRYSGVTKEEEETTRRELVNAALVRGACDRWLRERGITAPIASTHVVG